jgi:hypothetical protein
MVLREDPFRTPNINRKPVPLLINFADQQTVSMAPLGSASGKINGIRIQDVARNIWYGWDNGVWDNAGGGGSNAPPGQTPQITPGAGNLYIAFNSVNNGNVTGTLVLSIQDNSGILATNPVLNVPPGGNAGIEFTGNMPSNTYAITLAVTP